MRIFKYRYNRLLALLKQNGIKYLFIKILKKCFINSISSRINYYRYKDNYDHSLIFIAGFAKSGSTWFAKMMSSNPGFIDQTPVKWDSINQTKIYANDVMGVYPGLANEFKNKLVIIKGHTWGNIDNVNSLKAQNINKVIVTIRDPRDALISEYWYVRKNPWHYHYRLAATKKLSEYIDYHLSNSYFHTTRLEWINYWLERKEDIDIIFVKYEDLLLNPSDQLLKVFKFYNMKISEKYINKIINQNSFKTVSGRDKGNENTQSFVRKGIAGEWKEIFSEKQKDISSKNYEYIYKYFGYEF